MLINSIKSSWNYSKWFSINNKSFQYWLWSTLGQCFGGWRLYWSKLRTLHNKTRSHRFIPSLCWWSLLWRCRSTFLCESVFDCNFTYFLIKGECVFVCKSGVPYTGSSIWPHVPKLPLKLAEVRGFFLSPFLLSGPLNKLWSRWMLFYLLS